MTGHLTAAGASDAGRQRGENQDRFHLDLVRGFFVVIDGVGGHAAGSTAADVALAMLRARLERETGPVDERIREAITMANNEIHRLAASRPEWSGMACVLTVAVVAGGVATIGHVGDARLYKQRHGRITKVTRDHSPVGEREDAGEIGELEAMRHPRRNEVYRDVGSEPHAPGDPDFIEILTIPLEEDAALVLCSDGLSDLVSSAAIAMLVQRHAGDPKAAVRALIAAANQAGGKDNVTAICVQGDGFPATVAPVKRGWAGAAWTLGPAFAVLVVVAVLNRVDSLTGTTGHLPPAAASTGFEQVVRPGDSIMAAIDRAAAGSHVVVEPGEYREQLRLRDGVHVVSRVPRAATLRLPAGADATTAAVVADGLTAAGGFTGFRIVGDAATPLGVGLLARNAALSVVDVEITGATHAALDLAGAGASLVGGDIHDNPGLGLVIRTGASPRIAHSAFTRNGTPEGIGPSFVVEAGAWPTFSNNWFAGSHAQTDTGPPRRSGNHGRARP